MVATHRLTEQIKIYYLVSTGKTSFGENIPEEIYLKTIYASITTQRGIMQFDGNVSSVNYLDNISFYCRYQPELRDNKKQFRFHYEDKIYEPVNITHVQPRQATVIDLKNVS